MVRTLLLLFATPLLCLSCAHAANKVENDEKVDVKSLASWIAQLDSEEALQRMLAINALAEIGSKAEPAIQKLLELAAKDGHGYINQNARRALATIGDAAFDAIIEKLKSITEDDRPELYAAMLREFGKAFRTKLSAHLKK